MQIEKDANCSGYEAIILWWTGGISIVPAGFGAHFTLSLSQDLSLMWIDQL